MDRLLEIGEIGIIRDIPEELTQLEQQNHALKKQVGGYKFYTVLLVVVIVGIVWYYNSGNSVGEDNSSAQK